MLDQMCHFIAHSRKHRPRTAHCLLRRETKPEPQYSSQAALTVTEVGDGYKLVAFGQLEAAAIKAAVFCELPS
jgi:hypothetical protein